MLVMVLKRHDVQIGDIGLLEIQHISTLIRVTSHKSAKLKQLLWSLGCSCDSRECDY